MFTMFRHTFLTRFCAIATASLLCVLGYSAFGDAIAQSPNQTPSQLSSQTLAQAQDPSEIVIPTIEIPFDPDADEVSELPEEGTQLDSPLGEDSRAIVGRDDRYPVMSRAYPWSAVGRLEWHDRGQKTTTCTATLIAPDAILTNSHCLGYLRYNAETEEFDKYFLESDQYQRLLAADSGRSRMVFKPSLIEGVSLDSATVVSFESGWSAQSQESSDDWAVLTLDKPLGDYYGYLGWRSLDFANPDVLRITAEKIHLLGYAGDFPTPALRLFGNPAETAGIDVACSIVGVWPDGTPYAGTLAHDCDTNPGASGGPILAKFSDERYYLVGLHAQSTRIPETTLPNGVTTNVVNGGVQPSRWMRAAARARQ